MNKQYRPDIDGLRALAILPVVLYHVGFGPSGGFAGVDVFFVISGFLITGIILSEIEQQRFSIVRFYERRARRLLPALFAVITFATISSVILLIPEDLASYSESAVYTSFFAANFFFYSEMGYFNEAAELKPLLHAWSLGIEEQFYFVVPVTLVIFKRFLPKGVWVTALSLGVLSSFLLGIWLAGHPAGFYLPMTRAWELGIGMLLAIAVNALPAQNRVIAEIVSVSGVFLILVTYLLASNETLWPGTAALAPCLGAAAISFGGGAFKVHRRPWAVATGNGIDREDFLLPVLMALANHRVCRLWST